MAGGAIARVQAAAQRQGFLVLHEIVEVHGRELLVDRLIGFGRRLHFRFVLAFLAPLQHAGNIAQPAEQNQVDEGESDGDVKQLQPPPRQRIVEFDKILVPIAEMLIAEDQREHEPAA